MADRSYRVLLWGLALVGLFADQATKYGVFSWLHTVETHTYAVFQTEPEPRYFSVVPPDPDPVSASRQRGFFLEVAFEPGLDANGQPVPHVNHGALFGFLRRHKAAANGGFALISLLAAAAIILWSCQKATAADRWLCVALGLILGGTLGNFFDRLVFNGVRDFLHWNYLFDWPVFNVADCCLVVGACLLLLQAFVVPQPAQTPQTSEAKKEPIPAPAGVMRA
jgi:lipoprotein signal peptidase